MRALCNKTSPSFCPASEPLPGAFSWIRGCWQGVDWQPLIWEASSFDWRQVETVVAAARKTLRLFLVPSPGHAQPWGRGRAQIPPPLGGDFLECWTLGILEIHPLAPASPASPADPPRAL